MKHWCISKNDNFLFAIDFSDKYKSGIQRVGPNDKLFKREKYYNDKSFDNPYIIEDMLGEDFEPNYEIIMAEVKAEGVISQSVCQKIIAWLYVSKMRSPVMRDNPERVSSFVLKTQEKWGGKTLSASREKEIEDYSSKIAKKIHLSAFADIKVVEKLLMLYVETLLLKRWRILKSNPSFEFWTNDNPGFSPNVVARFAEQIPYHSIMELNSDSIILFPLSPKYCLELTPFEDGAPRPEPGFIDVQFAQASPYGIAFINEGVYRTRSRLIISNNEASLVRHF